MKHILFLHLVQPGVKTLAQFSGNAKIIAGGLKSEITVHRKYLAKFHMTFDTALFGTIFELSPLFVNGCTNDAFNNPKIKDSVNY